MWPLPHICQTSILTNLFGGRSDILICQTITCEIKHSNLESESCEQRYAPVGRWIISPAPSSCQPPTHRYCSLRQELFLVGKSNNWETQPQASIGWVALSSVVVVWSSRIGNICSHLHYMMFPSIQTIYFLWGYDPGNMSVSTYLLLLSWAQFAVVYLVRFFG